MSPWVQTFEDEAFDFEHPEQFAWPLKTVAHHLSQLCRYTGATKRFYSVAEHSWRVALLAADLATAHGAKVKGVKDVPLEAARGGLLHDVVESVIGDVSAPLKYMPFMTGFRDFEFKLDGLIAKRFGLKNVTVTIGDKEYDVIRSADLMALEFERKDLLGLPPRAWSTFDTLPAVKSEAFVGELGMTPEEAEALFLQSCKLLGIK